MAKQAKTAIKKAGSQSAAETKNWSKVIRAVKNSKSGGYTFTEAMINKDKLQDYLQSQKKA